MAPDPSPKPQPLKGPLKGPPEEQPLAALLDLLSLDTLPRTGWILRGVQPAESIAGHVLGVAHVALALAPRVEPPLDLARVLAMAIVHDAPEARSGDLPSPAAGHLPTGAKHALDRGLAAEVIAPLSGAALAAFEEYESQATPEARFVKACDRLQLGVRLLGYERAGWRGLTEFWHAIEPVAFAEFEPCMALAHALRSAKADTGTGHATATRRGDSA